MQPDTRPAGRREELVAAARQLFDEKGVEKTRVSDIVKKIGAAQGVFYYYFTSKEEMVQEVAAQLSDEVEGRMQQALADDALTFAQKAAVFLELYLYAADQFLPDDEPCAPQPGAPLPEGAQRWMQLLHGQLEALLRLGIEEGALALRHPHETAQVLLYGLAPYAFQTPPDRPLLYTLFEQLLPLPKGALAGLI